MRKTGLLSENYFALASQRVLPNLEEWLTNPAIDELSPNLKKGIVEAIERGAWDDIVNTFVRSVKFGTGGIRAMMAFDRASILRLKREGVDARILKGPNTINNVVVMTCACGVGRYFLERSGERASAVVGFDSRIQGGALARTVAEVLLSLGMHVYLFDEAVPYPEVTFAIPDLQADVGIFISASHNDFRYNGFKLSGPNGAQIPKAVRDQMLGDYILPTTPGDITWSPMRGLSSDTLNNLVFLGGSEPLPDADYFGRESSLVDMHERHIRHVKSFVLYPTMMEQYGPSIRVAFSAFNGSGRRAVPRMLRELGIARVHKISALDPLDGMFPAFRSDPGFEQQPDPGDPRAGMLALGELDDDASAGLCPSWEETDVLIGTDPDADRCGIVLPTPERLRDVMGRSEFLRFSSRHVHLPADDVWSLLLWYRLREGPDRGPNAFLAMSHTTSDMVAHVARKFGLGVLKTWVGFGWLSAGVAAAWGRNLPSVREGRIVDQSQRNCHMVFYDTSQMHGAETFNVAALEQSNGFSILGGPPADLRTGDRGLGHRGHVRDKDGTFAALLTMEVLTWAKTQGTTLCDLLANEIYSDPEVGLFVNYYEPDPLDGEYPGLIGDTKKKTILDQVVRLADEGGGGGLQIRGRRVAGVEVYWTGKYDEENWSGFPDEGIRFYLGSPGGLDHITVRPSGTGNSLRFHVQLYGGSPAPDEAWAMRLRLEQQAKSIVDELRDRIGAPREAGAVV